MVVNDHKNAETTRMEPFRPGQPIWVRTLLVGLTPNREGTIVYELEVDLQGPDRVEPQVRLWKQAPVEPVEREIPLELPPGLAGGTYRGHVILTDFVSFSSVRVPVELQLQPGEGPKESAPTPRTP
ncbi:MAG: hypothetical protein AB1758_06695 [Candidatus Eremiobacterota bacterium]